MTHSLPTNAGAFGISLDCRLLVCQGARDSLGEIGWATGLPACLAWLSLWVAAEAQAWLRFTFSNFCSKNPWLAP